MLKMTERVNSTDIAARLLEFIFCEANKSGSCQLSEINRHWCNTDPDQMNEAFQKLARNGYIRVEGGEVALELGNQNCFYTGFVKHPAFGRITFEFATNEKATNTEKDAAAYSALVSSFIEAGVEIKYIETNCIGDPERKSS